MDILPQMSKKNWLVFDTNYAIMKSVSLSMLRLNLNAYTFSLMSKSVVITNIVEIGELRGNVRLNASDAVIHGIFVFVLFET